jgi:hypothetical protein
VDVFRDCGRRCRSVGSPRQCNRIATGQCEKLDRPEASAVFNERAAAAEGRLHLRGSPREQCLRRRNEISRIRCAGNTRFAEGCFAGSDDDARQASARQGCLRRSQSCLDAGNDGGVGRVELTVDDHRASRGRELHGHERIDGRAPGARKHHGAACSGAEAAYIAQGQQSWCMWIDDALAEGSGEYQGRAQTAVPGKRQPQRDEPTFNAMRIRTFVAERLQRGEHVDSRNGGEQPSGILAHQSRQSIEQQRPGGGA